MLKTVVFFSPLLQADAGYGEPPDHFVQQRGPALPQLPQ